LSIHPKSPSRRTCFQSVLYRPCPPPRPPISRMDKSEDQRNSCVTFNRPYLMPASAPTLKPSATSFCIASSLCCTNDVSKTVSQFVIKQFSLLCSVACLDGVLQNGNVDLAEMLFRLDIVAFEKRVNTFFNE